MYYMEMILMKKQTDKKNRWKLIGSGIFAFLVYLFFPYLEPIPFQLVGVDIRTVPMIVKTIYLMIFEILIATIIISIFKDKVERDFQDMKKNHKKYFSTYIKYWFITLGLMMISNAIIILINHGDIANNEETIRETFKLAPIYTFLSAVIYAPLTEELVFRQGIRNIFKNDTLFIIVSGLVFGSLHVIPTYKVPLDLLYLIPYSIPGWVFAYTLKKSDNIFVPMGIHFIHNGVLMSLQCLLFFLS